MLHVVGSVIADDIDDGGLRLARVVQIDEPVFEPRAQMQQRRGRLVLHARVAIGGSGNHALEQLRH